MIGQTISHYQIKREIGRGGMGVVYLAEDLRLGRQVAVKALPRDLARDPIRRKRFEQEARACAALNHSAIAAVFDLEEAGDELFIIFEFVDGEDLRALIQGGPVPTARLLTLAQGMVRGLAAAHGAGIIHRDLKPENIRLTTAGEVKILDFGLARMQPELLSNAATFSMAITQQGSIVGTVGYMSPEQLESRELDARSDIFSLGVILYEMAAGVHPFQGESPASTIANVLTRDVAPIGQLNPVQPPALDRVVRKCLAKKKEQRYQSVADLLIDLEDLQRQTESGSRPVAWQPAAAPPDGQESESLLVSALSRMAPNPRRTWELYHLILAVGVPAVFPYIAWQARGTVGAMEELFQFFLVVIISAMNFVFRLGMLLSTAFDPAKKSKTLSRLGPTVRLTFVVLCLSVAFFAPRVASGRPVLGTLLASLAIAGLLVGAVVDPWIERRAFPELARRREELKAQDESAAQRGPRQWWLIHHLASMLVWTPLMAVLPWLLHSWLPQRSGLADFIVLLCVALALQNFGMRAYLLEVAWFHREALEANVKKMATPILICNLGLALLAGIIATLLFKAHFGAAVGFVVMAAGATMIVTVLERNFNRYAFPGLGARKPFRLDDLTRLGLMQLVYLASAAFLQVVVAYWFEIGWFSEIKAKIAIVDWLQKPAEFFIGATSLITIVVAPVMAWALLIHRRREAVAQFRKLFLVVALLYFGATGGSLLFALRYLSVPVGLALLTGMVYGIWYQWILAKRILAKETEQAHSVSAR